ncbi:hypothetical protein F4809DRAFT_555951 [Biscogniauxia mediterranea]|nr:hypothetical protein F4809DRAFT_555951 [Biscogniauxia mediterranea]
MSNIWSLRADRRVIPPCRLVKEVEVLPKRSKIGACIQTVLQPYLGAGVRTWQFLAWQHGSMARRVRKLCARLPSGLVHRLSGKLCRSTIQGQASKGESRVFLSLPVPLSTNLTCAARFTQHHPSPPHPPPLPTLCFIVRLFHRVATNYLLIHSSLFYFYFLFSCSAPSLVVS